MTYTPVLVVAAALTDVAGRVLVQQRPAGKQHGGLWEFPGGKVEPGEALEAALIRELDEELGLKVGTEDLEPITFATDAGGSGALVLLLYRIVRWSGTPEPQAAQAIRWATPDEIAALDMPPADRPLVAALARR